MSSKSSRRQFLKATGTVAAAATLPMSIVEIAWGSSSAQNFTFAYISDSHITQTRGNKFVENFDKGLERAVREANLMYPKPDFIIYGGDLAQLGKPAEIDHGMEMLSKLNTPVRWVIGEHDYYLDLGEYWQQKVSDLHYSFEHKGVHFVVLNSILTHQDWVNKWPTPTDRMHQMARLDNPNGSPFMVGDAQIEWLKNDLANVPRSTPLVVLSHSPLYKIFKPWNFWTEDAEQIQAI